MNSNYPYILKVNGVEIVRFQTKEQSIRDSEKNRRTDANKVTPRAKMTLTDETTGKVYWSKRAFKNLVSV